MENNKMIYGVSDKPKTIKEWILYPLQMVMAVFVATVLICVICGTNIPAGLLGAGVGTLIYQLLTRFKSPMFISSCGATTSAVIGALVLNTGITATDYGKLSYAEKVLVDSNYLYIAIGGLVIFLVYLIFGLISSRFGSEAFTKIFPPVIVGPVTIVIGLNLAKYISGYIGMPDSDLGQSPLDAEFIWPMVIALITMFTTAIANHYLKGFFKTVAFLIGLVTGYLCSVIVTICGWCDLVQFEEINSFFSLPDFAFSNWNFETFNFGNIGNILLLFIPVAICACLEHYSDHKTLSNIIDTDLTKEPGLGRTLIGNGAGSAVSTMLGGQPLTSYGEGVATIGFSRVASVVVTTIAAGFICLLAFIEPVRVFINSIPSCVFGGLSMILYGFIANSGVKLLIQNKVDLENSKNLLVVSVILTVGVSGIFFISESFVGVSLAMVLGVILNLILREKK